MTTSEKPRERRGVMQSLTGLSVRYVERLMPDPYLFAVILTLIVAALVAVFVRGAAPAGMLEAWYGGVWGQQNIFTFAFQMVLILVTGYTLAEAPALKRAIVAIAGRPRNQVQGALLCFAVSAVLSLLNWGLGLVAGALVARQVAKRFNDAHFGYLIAAAFMGFIVWTQGLSSSIALANTDESSPINVIHKITGMTVPLSQTIFQPYSWLSAIVVLAGLVALQRRCVVMPQLVFALGGEHRNTVDGGNVVLKACNRESRNIHGSGGHVASNKSGFDYCANLSTLRLGVLTAGKVQTNLTCSARQRGPPFNNNIILKGFSEIKTRRIS